MLIAFVMTAVLLCWPVRRFVERSSWLADAPRAGIVLWQSLTLGAAASTIGALAFGVALPFNEEPWRLASEVAASATGSPNSTLSPGELFTMATGVGLLALVLGAGLAGTVGQSRSRSRLRVLVDLCAAPAAGVPDALILDDERAIAYCLPGMRPRIVVSSAALDRLRPDELAAVLAHERAHVRCRHDLVLLPYVVAASLLCCSKVLAEVRDAVRCLVEMAADDRALRHCGRDSLALALVRLTSPELGSFELAASASATVQRLERLLFCHGHSRTAAAWSMSLAVAVLALPAIVYAWPALSR